MPRSKDVEAETAADRAMATFWRAGYASASLERLVRDTGSSRYGLYAMFRSKDGLLLEALARYGQTVTEPLIGCLQDETASWPEIRELFRRVGKLHRKAGRAGCLNCNVAVELGQTGSAPARHVGRQFADLRMRLARALGNARGRQLSGNLDVQRHADHLLGVFAGSFLLARAGMQPAMIRGFVETALEGIERRHPPGVGGALRPRWT